MEELDNLEKLAKLRDKDIINEEEYNNIKNHIVNRQILVLEDRKSGVAYALLAWFLGIFGAHNFYAGYTKRAIVQLLMTLFSWVLLFVPLFLVQIWALGDMCLINKDAKGIPFGGDKAIIMIVRVAAVVFFVLTYFFGFMGMFMYLFMAPGTTMPMAM